MEIITFPLYKYMHLITFSVDFFEDLVSKYIVKGENGKRGQKMAKVGKGQKGGKALI